MEPHWNTPRSANTAQRCASRCAAASRKHSQGTCVPDKPSSQGQAHFQHFTHHTFARTPSTNAGLSVWRSGCASFSGGLENRGKAGGRRAKPQVGGGPGRVSYVGGQLVGSWMGESMQQAPSNTGSLHSWLSEWVSGPTTGQKRAP